MNLHDWEILDPRHVLQAKLHPYHNVLVGDIVLSIGPRPNTCRQFVLICVLAASEELAVPEFRHIYGVIGKAEMRHVNGWIAPVLNRFVLEEMRSRLNSLCTLVVKAVLLG